MSLETKLKSLTETGSWKNPKLVYSANPCLKTPRKCRREAKTAAAAAAAVDVGKQIHQSKMD